MPYTPDPLHTADVVLPPVLTELTELLARNTHEVWAAERIAQGWRHGPQRDDARKLHPCLVPYEELPESEKQFDRQTAMQTLKAIVALGFHIDSGAAPDEDGDDVRSAARRLTEARRLLRDPTLDVLKLFHRNYRYDDRLFWKSEPQVHHDIVRRLISAGHALHAFEYVSKALSHLEGDADLLYLRALAMMRGKNYSKAGELAGELLVRLKKSRPTNKPLLVETQSLLGRLAKDRAKAATGKPRQQVLAEAISHYLAAFKLNGASFPAINAATLCQVAGRGKEARELAKTVIERVAAERKAPGAEKDYWLLATLGEAYLNLGDANQAAEQYRAALQLAGRRLGDIASMRSNVTILAEVIDVPRAVLELFHVGSVVVFAAAPLTVPQLSQSAGSRQPLPLTRSSEEKMRAAIVDALNRLDPAVGYCRPTCGAGVIFAEQIIERGKELHVVLPFDNEDFYRTSVDYGQVNMASWRHRCDRILAKAERHHATTELFLGDQVLFDFADQLSQGLGLLRAVELGVQAEALVVEDPSVVMASGQNTTAFAKAWRTSTGRDAIRILSGSNEKRSTLRPGDAGRDQSPESTDIAHRRRHIRSMLFADVKNYSKLQERHSPAFMAQFLRIVRSVIDTCRKERAPQFTNTWGDGLFLVFGSVVACADFAMRLLDRIATVDWTRHHLPADTTVRMGVHTGPVYKWQDQVIERYNFFGSHVNRAARIEPVTTPGCVFASEQFAAALAVEKNHEFALEYVGMKDLAKGYDRCALYRLARKQGS